MNDIRRVNELQVGELPQGKISKLAIELVHDALGRSVAVPVLVARGSKPGPVFGITAAVHGNELNGIPVLHRLFEQIDVAALRGTVVGVVVVNVPGYLMHQREFNDGSDLNHLMPGVHNGNTAQVYAHRFLERVVRPFTHLVDLHTASFGRINSLYVRADLSDPVAAKMAHLVRPQIIVNNPPSDRTLRGAADIPAITTEIGNPQRYHRDYIKRTLSGLRSMLGEAGLTRKRPPAKAPPKTVVCDRSFWIYTDHGGLLDVFPDVTERVKAGQVIARLSDAYGGVLREYKSPADGIVIGRSVNPVAQTGARILHLGIIAEDSAEA